MSDNEGSFASRKFILSIVSMVLISAASFLCAWKSSMVAVMPTFISGVLGVLTVYLGGNIVNKQIVGKLQQETKPEVTKPAVVAKKTTTAKESV